MRHKRLGQRERAQVVRRERHVPAPCVLRRAHLHDARIVDYASDGKMKIDNLGGRASHARDIRQVALNRHRVSALLLDDPL